jgi:DNA-directed RNA polymerase specialized sigma24 family protein
VRRSRYSEDTIRNMIESYEQLKALEDTKPGRKLDTLLRVADLDRALDLLPMDLWRVMLVHGLIGVPRDETAQELGLSTGAVSKRFRHAVEELHFHMNGGQIDST